MRIIKLILFPVRMRLHSGSGKLKYPRDFIMLSGCGSVACFFLFSLLMFSTVHTIGLCQERSTLHP